MANEIVEKLKKEIDKLNNKEFKVFFFVYDTKGTPSGSLAYIYENAYALLKAGYNVQMLHAEPEFVGVESWLGEKYASIPHFHIQKDTVVTSPCDFLFIPEVCANVMANTKDTLNCKRIAICTSFAYLLDTIPMGASWGDMKINECIVTSENLAEKIKEVMPYIKTHIIRPSIPTEFYDDRTSKGAIVNVIVKNPSDLNAIIKPFYWKYPAYNWIAFRPISNINRRDVATAMKESFATIWCDPATDFGRGAVEAMAANNIIIGKIPDSLPEWMITADGALRNNGVWFYNLREAKDAIASVIQSFITDSIPEQIYTEMKATVTQYTENNVTVEMGKVYEEIFESRKDDLNAAIEIENKENLNNESNE